MNKPIQIDVTFPKSCKTRTFRSIHAVARMLSGTGRASGGLRSEISFHAQLGERVRNNRVYDTVVELNLPKFV
jgi:hypothetical protein